MTVKIKPRENSIGWKVEENGETVFKTDWAKIIAMEEAEEIAEDPSDIEVYTIDGQNQEFDKWKTLKSKYN